MLLFWALLLFLTISDKFAFPMNDILDWHELLQIRSVVDLAAEFKTPLCKMVIFLCEFCSVFSVSIFFHPKQSRIKSPHPSWLWLNYLVYILLKHLISASAERLFFFFGLKIKASQTLQALLCESDIFQLLFCKLLERQIMRWEPSYANKATSFLAKNSFSTCALRWKWRPLVYIQQTVMGGRREGKLQIFV